jgi:capsular polysaccharide biosynthesis protein
VTAGPGDWMPAGPVGRGRLRVSHLDREFVVEVLKAAFVQGRLSKDEFDLRVGQSLAARTLTVLAALIADLPAGLVTARQRPMPARAQPRPRPPASRVATSGAAAVAALGLLAGIVVTLLSPPVFTSSTTVLLRPSAARYIGTQVALAGSDPVLAAALPSVRPAISLPALRRGIEVKSLTDRVLSISAQGATTTQAARTANAVADSYVHFADANMTPGGARAQVLDRAVAATGTPLPARLLVAGGLGALLGALIGAIAALAFRRSNRRSRI